MPWVTFVWVTVLISIICGNRLMDNHLLRSSYRSSLKPINKDEFLDTLPEFKEDFKATKHVKFTLDSSSLCSNEMHDNKHEFQLNRRCFDNAMDIERQPINYANYENDAAVEVDELPTFNDLKHERYTNNFEDIFDVEDIVNEQSKLLNPLTSSLPVASYKEFYADLVLDSNKDIGMKRNGNTLGPLFGSPSARGCDCKLKNDLVDLGQQHFPRYLLNAICQTDQSRNNDIGPKCWSGSICRPLEYKVKVLTFRSIIDNVQKDATLAWLPDDLRQIWKFKTVTVTAGCFCS